ncbi:MAG: ComEA family DNA-binding protein [Cyanobacteria bacterium P01_E01_bin.43]
MRKQGMANHFRPSQEPARRPLQAWLRQFHPARARLQRDPLARLDSLEEVVIAADLGITIDVNQATIDDWLRLPGLSIHQARTLATLSQNGVVFCGLDDIAAALGISIRALEPLSPILAFCYYDPESLVAAQSTSLNQATVGQLMALPGMSARVAEQIINERRRSPFLNWSDAHHRLRLSAAQTSQWMHYLNV